MPVLEPILTPPKLRDFAVIDLEWVPGEPLDPPAHTEVAFDGMRDLLRIPMPVGLRQTKPLKIRLASCYDQVPECEPSDYDDDPIRVERFVSFPTVKELLDDILVRENRHKWFFAHAGGLSDMEFVLDEILMQIKAGIAAQDSVTVRMAEGALKEKGMTKHEDWTKGEWKVRASFSGSSAIIIHLSQGKNAWHFIDSYWLLRDKLANIGKAIGVKKGDGPLAAAYLQERFHKESLELLDNQELEDFYRECPMDVLVEYNRVDCEILWKAIYKFEQEILELGGQLQQTIASTGMALCRRAYLKQTIYTSEKINQIAERSYYASRVEVISRNLENFRTYDINSSFPYSMTFPQPGGLKGVRTTLPDNDDETCIYIAEVDIEVPDMPFPPVPYRSGGRVFFPTGRWRAWFTSTDIRLALREGCTIHKVYEVYEFEPFYDLKNYVIDIYAKRAAADTDFRKLVLKYLLNCLYGKYAESTSKQEMLINPDGEIDREEMQLLQPGIWLRDRTVTIDHRHVPISTHITSLSRRTLYDYGKMCYEQGKPSAYFDTDSLNTQAELPCDDKKLGALKLEKNMTWGEFFAPKIYRGEGFEIKKNGTVEPIKQTKAKGFSLGKAKQEAWERFDQIVSGNRIGIQRMVRMRELYRSGMTAPVDILVIKALTFEMLSKRFQYPDGETRPWSVGELLSGEVYPKGFDFDPELLATLDTTTKAMIQSAF